MTDIEEAREALAGIKQFWCLDDADYKISRLGGLTNLVFRVEHGGEQYVLRLPGKGTDEYINRKNEAQAAYAAAKAGVSPEVLFFDLDSGIMVTRLVDDSVTMSIESFKSIVGAPARAGEVLKSLHTSGAVFNARFDLFEKIEEYQEVLSSKKAKLPDGYADVLKQADTVRDALKAHSLPSVACHCDPLAENFLDTGSRMWLVDWEYAGMNDPMWDLGDVSVEAQFTHEQDEEMIRAYFGGEASAAERGRIVVYKAMADLLWTLWGLIQHANKNPADDFWAYSVNRFKRCQELMVDPAFAGHVEAVAKG